jgi:hypothetical protein
MKSVDILAFPRNPSNCSIVSGAVNPRAMKRILGLSGVCAVRRMLFSRVGYLVLSRTFNRLEIYHESEIPRTLGPAARRNRRRHGMERHSLHLQGELLRSPSGVLQSPAGLLLRHQSDDGGQSGLLRRRGGVLQSSASVLRIGQGKGEEGRRLLRQW